MHLCFESLDDVSASWVERAQQTAKVFGKPLPTRVALARIAKLFGVRWHSARQLLAACESCGLIEWSHEGQVWGLVAERYRVPWTHLGGWQGYQSPSAVGTSVALATQYA